MRRLTTPTRHHRSPTPRLFAAALALPVALTACGPSDPDNQAAIRAELVRRTRDN